MIFRYTCPYKVQYIWEVIMDSDMGDYMKISVVRLPHLKELPLPAYATLHSAGMDLYAAIDSDVTINSQERVLIPSGIAVALPEGYEAQIRSRSGLAFKHGLIVVNSPGTIDADYRGEILVALVNLSKEPFDVKRGTRIAQMVITKYSVAEWSIVDVLPSSHRGQGGFGSSGML